MGLKVLCLITVVVNFDLLINTTSAMLLAVKLPFPSLELVRRKTLYVDILFLLKLSLTNLTTHQWTLCAKITVGCA